MFDCIYLHTFLSVAHHFNTVCLHIVHQQRIVVCQPRRVGVSLSQLARGLVFTRKFTIGWFLLSLRKTVYYAYLYMIHIRSYIYHSCVMRINMLFLWPYVHMYTYKYWVLYYLRDALLQPACLKKGSCVVASARRTQNTIKTYIHISVCACAILRFTWEFAPNRNMLYGSCDEN